MALDNTLSLFVDESGILGEPAEASRFYILGLVLHDQRFAIEPAAATLDRRLEEIEIKDLCFHAGPFSTTWPDYARQQRISFHDL